MNFLNPTYYDVADITDDMPNKALLVELFEAMNEQNERLWMFFELIDEDPEHKVMKKVFIKPRQHRRKRAVDKNRYKRDEYTGRMVKQPQPIDNTDSEEFMDGYKAFLKDEFGE